MTAAKHDMVWEQGTTIRVGFILRESPPEGAPEGTLGPTVNLTEWTARMHIRTKLPSEIILHSFTTENGGIQLSGDGEILILASATESAAWQWPVPPRSTKSPVAVYDLELINPFGEVKRFLEGKITLNLEVTR